MLAKEKETTIHQLNSVFRSWSRVPPMWLTNLHVSARPEPVAAETSDDDIQLLSSEEEKEDGHAEDTNNSGSHTDDTCNVPDSLGRVLVNVGHPPAEMDIFIAPQIARNIKPHQVREAKCRQSACRYPDKCLADRFTQIIQCAVPSID